MGMIECSEVILLTSEDDILSCHNEFMIINCDLTVKVEKRRRKRRRSVFMPRPESSAVHMFSIILS